MVYDHHFDSVDELIKHLDTVLLPGFDPLLTQTYVGFLSVSIVTCFEACIKDSIIDFAGSKHPVFGQFCKTQYDRINGRIKTSELKGSHLSRMGRDYESRFRRLLNWAERLALKNCRGSVESSYNNLVVCRNQFAHGAELPNMTYSEMKHSYELSKVVIECFYRALKK